MAILGEVEVPTRNSDGTLVYNSSGQPMRSVTSADEVLGLRPVTRGVTQRIIVRSPAERQVPPGYSGPPNGPVTVILPPTIRYFRLDPAIGEVAFEGKVACMPDEAVQLVAVAGATYA
jgi:hypothetical protein